ncbi:CopG family transcriptional regulator [Franconibacter helveticus]|uniref:ribbon-helix-helix domain-containing protein n=2 Tax=Franconibacter helveticus TaxID=357240 RepID=UPI000DA1D480|nr:CopG family transcriptional regulator [Franconibacter helveticus]
MSMLIEGFMGRILLDLPDEAIRRLEQLKERRKLPRAELLREAVEQYLDRQNQDVLQNALGLWGEGAEDGLAYERKLREEW